MNTMYLIISIIVILIILFVLYYIFLRNNNTENFKHDNSVNLYKEKKIIITSPYRPNDKYITNEFRFKTWDGSDWTAKIINDKFYIKRKESNRLIRTNIINILRFRSQQWQITYLENENKFLVFRFGGIRGMLFKKLDLVDWNDESYTIEVM
jgi:hypothetical protein